MDISYTEAMGGKNKKNYFLKDPEDAYSLIKPLNETFNEELLNGKGT